MNQGTSQTIEEVIAAREKKLAELRASGANAYPNDFQRTGSVAEIRAADLDAEVCAAGRLVSVRLAGKAAFANIEDETGAIQLYAGGKDAAALDWLKGLDLGDVVGVQGALFKTKKDELTIQVASGRTLAKCLQPFAPKSPLTEDRQRKRRYLALAMSAEQRDMFKGRSKMVAELRSFFDGRGYVEVETPMLHQVQGGALAKPFVTRHETLDRNYFLRIAPELYLKRLLVGGYDKVYEINRSFRNEGMSDEHNPEFTMLEFYAAYERFEGFIDLITELLRQTAAAARSWRPAGADAPAGVEALAGPYNRMKLAESLQEAHGWSADQAGDADFLQRFATERLEGVKVEEAAGDRGRLQCLVFEKTVEATLGKPTYITHFPASVSPLARRCDDDPTVAERFELIVNGSELANGFSELNDPDEQARVFQEQVRQARLGDQEAMEYDEDYITALRYGMPPATGAGIGVDRLAMLLFGCKSIRDVILFPQLKPERPSKD